MTLENLKNKIKKVNNKNKQKQKQNKLRTKIINNLMISENLKINKKNNKFRMKQKRLITKKMKYRKIKMLRIYKKKNKSK